MTGADARHGDIVRNLTTGETAHVVCGTNSGRLAVSSISADGPSGPKWERYNVEVIERPSNV